jgi:hypothetical protein
MDEFRRLNITAVSCYTTDSAVRRTLFRRGFFRAPQRKPIQFIRFLRRERTDLAKFAPLKMWYLTMGDGDLEMAS